MNEVDLVEAARGAIFVAIAAGLIGTGAVALDHVPQDQPGNFVQLDDLDWTNEGGKHDPELRITIDVVSIYRGENRAELLRIMNANHRAVVEATLTAPGVILQAARLLGGGASGAGADGVTYAGLQTFELYAEPA